MQKVVPKNAILIPDDAERVFEGVIYDVYQWDQDSFGDAVLRFEMLKRPDTVTVLPVIDGKVCVITDEQPHRGTRIGFPGGRVDDTDASTLVAAQRETKEEIGYEFKNWKLLEVYQPQAKLEWFIYVYVAWDVANKGDTHHDDGEKITHVLKELTELKQLVDDGVGYLGEARDVFGHINSVDDLTALPEYQGTSVSR